MQTSIHSRDKLISIFSAIIPTMVVGIPITMQPGFVEGLTSFMGISEVKAGYIMAAELFGLTAGTVLFAFIATLMNWKRIMGGAIILLIAANILTIFMGNDNNLLPLRSLAGLGGGLITAVGFASLANTQKPGRNYGWLIACVIGFSAVGFAVLPLIFSAGGYKALLWVFTAILVACLVASRFVTSDHNEERAVDTEGDSGKLLSPMGLSALVSVLLFFIAYMGVFTYMFSIGGGNGLDDAQVVSVLSITQFFGVAGALAISFLASRVRHRWLAIGIYVAGIVGIFAFKLDMAFGVFLALNAVFQFCWNAGQPLLLAIIASRQASGAIMRFAIPLQFIGMAIGPAIAATVLDKTGGYGPVITVSGILALLSFLLITPFILKLKRKDIGVSHGV